MLEIVSPKTYAPEQVRFWRDSWQQLFLENGSGPEGPIKVKRAFPLTEPDRFIVITDIEGEFIGMLDTCRGLDPDSFRVLEEELEHEYFLPQITKINSIKDEYRVMNWSVETDRGPRTFEVTNRRQDIRWLSDDHVVIQDADGNKYEIKELSQLDSDSQQLLEVEA